MERENGKENFKVILALIDLSLATGVSFEIPISRCRLYSDIKILTRKQCSELSRCRPISEYDAMKFFWDPGDL